jgi:hypothetical protein
MRTLIVTSNTYTDVTSLTKPHVHVDKDQPLTFYELSTDPEQPNHFGTRNWNLICKEVAQKIVDTMKSMETGDVLLYSDADVLFLEQPKWFTDRLGDADMRFQYETGFGPCFGFFAVRISPQTIELLERTVDATNEKTNSQVAFLGVSRGSQLKIEYFDTKDVWNYAVLSGGRVWHGEDFELPEGIKALHANFIVGTNRKVMMIEKAIAKYFPAVDKN